MATLADIWIGSGLKIITATVQSQWHCWPTTTAHAMGLLLKSIEPAIGSISLK